MDRVALRDPEGVRFVPDVPSGDAALVIAGSSGRVDVDRAAWFAAHGFVAESFRWFGGPRQHDGPWEVPLESFVDRIERLRTTSDRVWVVGTSLGSEAALLVGGQPGVAGVVAFAPSDVVWSWPDASGLPRSHWTLGGEPLPFVAVDPADSDREVPPRFRPRYERSYRRDPARTERATIRVDGIRELLLVAGGDDQVWPSRDSADRIVARRSAAGLGTVLVTAAAAGHRTVLPGEPVLTGGQTMQRGGSESADRELGTRAGAAVTELTARRGTGYRAASNRS